MAKAQAEIQVQAEVQAPAEAQNQALVQYQVAARMLVNQLKLYQPQIKLQLLISPQRVVQQLKNL